MILIEKYLLTTISKALKDLYAIQINEKEIQVQKTKKEFEGDFTVVVFPLLKYSKQSLEQTAEKIGNYLIENTNEVEKYNIIKGFLNISIHNFYWIEFLGFTNKFKEYGKTDLMDEGDIFMIEYSSPNTNKPLHLGHIRNNLLGYSLSKIIEANGHKVIKVNLVNDRGIHICKSMLAWQKWGNGETPENSGKKGDHLVGDYYVKFEQVYKNEVSELTKKGYSQEKAFINAPIIIEAQEMLRKWEANDKETVELWQKMNNWVYEGFNETYKKLGVDFDKIYYESDTFSIGKQKVLEGLEKGIFYKKDDGSVWVDLTSEGLDHKLLIRSDGTTVYMTQDIGTAMQRVEDYNFDEMVYVVGNEQDYHFKVLSIILDKLGFPWAENLVHLSYGMVELPTGKMKSREGKVVDADDLIEEMINTAREMSKELGKLDEFNESEKENIFRIIGLGALKYFILKVDPKKNMTFDPVESIDFNGNTGPFIQYTYARIQSVLRKAKELNLLLPEEIVTNISINNKEKELIKLVYFYPEIIVEAGESYSPSVIANYLYELVKNYNQFYHDFSILKEPDESIRDLRIMLSVIIGRIIKSAMDLLGIEVPDRM